MIYVQVKGERDPRVLADLIASTHGDEQVEVEAKIDRRLVATVRQHIEADRPTHDQLETVNFQRLDDENDWTDL